MPIFWVDREILTQQLHHSVSLKRSSWQQMYGGLLETRRLAHSETSPKFPSLPLAFVLRNRAPDHPNTSSFIPQQARTSHTSSTFVETKLMPGATALCSMYVLALPFATVLSDCPDSDNGPLPTHKQSILNL